MESLVESSLLAMWSLVESALAGKNTFGNTSAPSFPLAATRKVASRVVNSLTVCCPARALENANITRSRTLLAAGLLENLLADFRKFDEEPRAEAR